MVGIFLGLPAPELFGSTLPRMFNGLPTTLVCLRLPCKLGRVFSDIYSVVVLASLTTRARY